MVAVAVVLALAGVLGLGEGPGTVAVATPAPPSGTAAARPDPAPIATTDATDAGAVVVTDPPATVRPPTGSGQAVTIAFGGDSHFESFLRTRLEVEGASMLAPLGELFAGADLTVVNLETAITTRGAPEQKEWTFRAPPRALDALASVGVDAVSMANNHGLDYGQEGLEDSLSARDVAPLAVIGVGRDATDAYAPFRATVNGQRIAVIGATQVLDDHLVVPWTARDAGSDGTPARPGLASAKDVDRLVRAVADARAESDTVVVFLHWGLERTECPTAVQRDLAPTLLAAGADIVVGGHSHRVEGAGRMGEGFVAYGLGNFVWFNGSGPNGDSGALLVTATGRRIDGYEWRPARVTDGVPTPLRGAAAAEALVRWEGLRTCTGLTG